MRVLEQAFEGLSPHEPCTQSSRHASGRCDQDQVCFVHTVLQLTLSALAMQLEEDTARVHTNAAAACNAAGSHIAVADANSGVRVFATARATRLAAAGAGAAGAHHAIAAAVGGGGAGAGGLGDSKGGFRGSVVEEASASRVSGSVSGEVATLRLQDKCALLGLSWHNLLGVQSVASSSSSVVGYRSSESKATK